MAYDLKNLDFDVIRRALEKLTFTPYGAEAARELEPPEELEIARRMQQSVSAGRRLSDAGALPRLDEVPSIRAALRQAASPGASLNPRALRNILEVMAAARQLDDLLERAPELYPQSREHLWPDEDLREVLEHCIEPGGVICRQASEALADLHGQYEAQRGEAEAVIRRIQKRPELKAWIKDPGRIHWQGVRAVVAIKAEGAEQIKGVRRGSQSGGMDQLVEPLEAVAANNQLERLAGKISAEQQRLLRELTARVHASLPVLERMLDAMTWIDLALAGGRLSAQMGAHAPRLVDEPGVELRQAYHPLLLMQFIQGTLERPVPLSLRLDDETRFLLITGPNTGGKTVALKTLGLLVIMAQCGLHIPAEEDCTIGWYRSVMVDMGDRQSLYHQLSTFAGHVEVMKQILERADERSLLLLDELGTGTDPKEGAALAMAMMDEMVDRHCQGIVNSHLSPLKDYAEHQPHIVNAAMSFDRETLSPTYRLTAGVSGESLGLTIAERNGLATEVVARARHYWQRLNPGKEAD